ncbi:MAG: class I SAM-dependent methyltransferase [Elusimicrobiaceae bacterium]|nr:class I SAM-dependent methyltransferase [Elusimicrobiaceae bacterium]
MARHKMGAAAALIMQWVKVNSSGAAKRYADLLDLSEADPLYISCAEICPWYAEVIFNRKFMIKRLIQARLDQSELPCQLVLLGSGWSPLALELIETRRARLAQIFEIDHESPAEKKKLFYEVEPLSKGLVTFIGSELGALDRLDKHGIRRDIPSIILLEGASYFLPPKTLAHMMRLFKSGQRHNYCIAEYLVPEGQVTSFRRDIPHAIFDSIAMAGGYADMTTYNRASLSALFRGEGGEPLEHFTLSDMEKQRTGETKFFPSADHGWIEILTAEL